MKLTTAQQKALVRLYKQAVQARKYPGAFSPGLDTQRAGLESRTVKVLNSLGLVHKDDSGWWQLTQSGSAEAYSLTYSATGEQS